MCLVILRICSPGTSAIDELAFRSVADQAGQLAHALCALIRHRQPGQHQVLEVAQLCVALQLGVQSGQDPTPAAEELEDGLRPPPADARLQLTYSRVCDGL